MKKNLKLYLFSLILVALSSPAWAVSVPIDSYWNVNVFDDWGTGDGVTGTFSSVEYISHTTSFQYDTDGSGDLSTGDVFVDYGNAYATALEMPLPTDMEGLNQSDGYYFSFAWDNLLGNVKSITPTQAGDLNVQTTYQSGSIDFWLDTAVGTLAPNHGDNVGVQDDANFDRGDSRLVATVDIIKGTGNNLFDSAGNLLTGSFNLTGQFSFLKEGFWFEDGTDADLAEKYVSLGWLLGFTSGDTKEEGGSFTQTFGGEDFEGNDVLFTIDSRHSQNFTLEVIPEPSTIILLGAGLLGTGIMLRRKNRK